LFFGGLGLELVVDYFRKLNPKKELEDSISTIMKTRFSALEVPFPGAALDIDNAKRRVSLGMKQCTDNPWENFQQTHKDGENITGNIKSITDFGIFVELQGGIDGLIHISDVSWDTEENIDLSVFKKSDEIETVIISIDAKKQRISFKENSSYE
jgi:polyribonucleotide nucleotidyltransferase